MIPHPTPAHPTDKFVGRVPVQGTGPDTRVPVKESAGLPDASARRGVVPVFSVCIVVRDRPALLLKSVQSVLASKFEDFELVIVDDGSAVPAAEGLQAAGVLDDGRVRVVRQVSAGIATARNTSLAAATGRFVTVLDSDDELAEDALGRLHDFLVQTGAEWVYTDYQEIVGNSRQLISLPGYPSPRKMLQAVLVRPRLPFKHSGMTIDLELMRQLGGYDATIPIKVDVEFVLRALSQGHHLRHLAHPVVRFHRHGGNVSRRRIAGLRMWFKLIRRYSQSRVPGGSIAIMVLRTSSELGKWAVSIVGR